MKDKERRLKAAGKKKQIIYKGVPIWLVADFSAKPYMPGEDLMIYSKC